MITNNPVRYLAKKDCPYSLNGRNLVEMRRAKLRLVAKKLGVSPDGSKQDILHRLIGQLRVMNAPSELSDV